MYPKRIKTVAILSFLLLGITAILYVRSYFKRDVIGIYFVRNGPKTGDGSCYVLSANSVHGRFQLFTDSVEVKYRLTLSQGVHFSHRAAEKIFDYSDFGWRSFRLDPLPSGIGVHRQFGRMIAAPYWAVFLPHIVVIAWYLRVNRTAFPTGLCKKCGYNLRNTPKRCPECGNIA